MSNYTKGPWKVVPPLLDGSLLIVQDHSEILVAGVFRQSISSGISRAAPKIVDPIMQEANANLIAAAPELAISLINILRHAEKQGLCKDSAGLVLLNSAVDVLERAGCMS